MSNKWTEKELSLLNENFPTLYYNIPELLETRTVSSIISKAFNLGLMYNDPHKWTKEETSLLEEKYPELGINIPELLKTRTSAAIESKAQILGLRYNDPHKWTEEEISLLKDCFPSLGSNIPELLKKRTADSIKLKALKLGLTHGKQNLWTEEEISLLKENYSTLHCEIPELLKTRTEVAIRVKAQALGLTNKSETLSLYEYCQKNPDKKYLLDEWNYEENAKIGLTPQTVGFSSSKEAYWICSVCGNEFELRINNKIRKKAASCCCCDTHQSSIPEMALYYYLSKIYSDTKHRYTELGFELDIYIPSIKTAIEYDGSFWHENKLELDNKKDQLCKDNGIRLIRLRARGLEKTCLAENISMCENTYKQISEGIEEVFNYLNITYDFKIDIDFDLQNIVDTRRLKKRENSLASIFPEIAAEWHPTLNGNLNPFSFSPHSSTKVAWKCSKCGHEWKSIISSRTGGSGCCRCNNHVLWTEEEIEILKNEYPVRGTAIQDKIPHKSRENIKTKAHNLGIKHIKTSENKPNQFQGEDNYLSFTHPEIAAQWHPTLNGNLMPDNISYGSNKKVWWMCSEGHIHQESVKNRVKYGCPDCSSRVLWTQEDVEILRKYYPIEGLKVADRFPNRTKKAVEVKVKKLKLKKLKK